MQGTDNVNMMLIIFQTCVLLICYAAENDNSLPTFRESLIIKFQGSINLETSISTQVLSLKFFLEVQSSRFFLILWRYFPFFSHT